MDERVATRYAGALFGAARQKDATTEVEADLRAIVTVIEGDKRFHDLLVNPEVGRDRLKSIFERSFSGKVHPLVMALLNLAATKGRQPLLGAILREYTRMRRDHEGVVHVRVTSSWELSDDERNRVLEKVAAISGKRLEPEFVVDPALIGGLTVAYENLVLDGSIRGHFARLSEDLRYKLLKQA
ncbi:MAG: ATP synthase F1 subunit delta [Fimbriimonadaceae bacterium]